MANLTSRVDGSTPLYDGGKDPDRRARAERGPYDVVAIPNKNDNDEENFFVFDKYVKITPTYAVKVPFDFEVETLEGRHFGKSGSYLAVGQAGEMYPIDAEIFETTYVKGD